MNYKRIIALLLYASATPKAMSMLAGKRVLVTGGGRGIGRAIAHICADEGAQVAICSRNKIELEETVSTCTANGSESCPAMELYVTDVMQEDKVDHMVKSIVDKWGGIDVLINNAGKNQAGKGPAQDLKAEDFKAVLDMNIISVHTVTSSVLRHSMLKQQAGRIINISSKAGKVGLHGMSFYVASKFALEGYSASLSEELKDQNIIVNTISPGMVDTSSFPKAPGKKGVRTADSVKDGLMLLLETEKTGHFVHVDELDQVMDKNLDASLALKPINEALFSV